MLHLVISCSVSISSNTLLWFSVLIKDFVPNEEPRVQNTELKEELKPKPETDGKVETHTDM